jgi:GNAT superfamily N-acetyltransferase
LNIREALRSDIAQMMNVRLSVKENALTDPGKFSAADYEDYLFNRGKGWVCEIDHRVIGFAIVDNKEHIIWALFVVPEYERRGIGRKLHDIMLDWYFNQTTETIWLSTAAASRAEKFYRTAGWREAGLYGKNEIKFEMTFANWMHKVATDQ